MPPKVGRLLAEDVEKKAENRKGHVRAQENYPKVTIIIITILFYVGRYLHS